jgi:hypothetical protein
VNVRCYIIPPEQYVSKAHWNLDAGGWINANPRLIQDGPFAGSYAIPEDFFHELVTQGSPLNTAIWDRMQGKVLDNVEDFNPPPPPPYVPPPPPPPAPPYVPPYVPPPSQPPPYQWPEGSLGGHVDSQVSSRLAGKEPLSAMPIYSVQDHNSGTYVRNPNCWASDLDLTGISSYNTWDGVRGAGTLITRRHGVVCAHFAIYGTPFMRFIKADGTVVTRQVLKSVYHPLYNPPVTRTRYPDLSVFVLDEDLPEDIKHYKLLPPNFSNYISDDLLGAGRPLCFGTNQQESACVAAANKSDPQWFGHTYSRRNPLETSFWAQPAKGDSNSGFFFVINGEPVLIFTLTGNGGTKLHLLIDDINQMIVACDNLVGASTGYSIETADLSEWEI